MKLLQVEELRQQIHELETSGFAQRGSISLDVEGLEALLPDGVLPRGCLVELLEADPGCGTGTLALWLARAACTHGRGLFLVDADHSFYPPAAVPWGFDLNRLLLARPKAVRSAMVMLGQALRSSAVGAVLGRVDQFHTRDYRRLQLAAERSGALGILLRPQTQAGTPSFAYLRWAVTPLPSHLGKRRLQVDALRLRGDAGNGLVLEIDDEAHTVHALPKLAPAMLPAKRTGTAG